MNRTALTCTALASITLLGSAWLTAGPLSPPAGPVASTFKTLAEVEPRIAINETNTPGDSNSLFKITQPGSYYLTGNIVGVAGKDGIEINSSDVSIDLRGFSLNGVPGSSVGIISTTPFPLGAPTGILVHNGSLQNWGASGIDLLDSGGASVKDIATTFNGATGIRTGPNAIIERCVANSSNGHGINAGNNCAILSCVAVANLTSGFSLGAGCTVTHCTATGNAGHGFTGSSNATISDCIAQSNQLNGFDLTIFAMITRCTASSNLVNGIEVVSASTVAECNVFGNGLHGIRAQSGTMIRGNHCASNGDSIVGANIHTFSNNNVIESNRCNFARFGIQVSGSAGNVVIRNLCTDNVTNWNIVPGNAVAPIVSAQTNASTINGNTYSGTMGSTDPNANFTY